MPGNEVGDTDHNFFSQENFSQGQGRFEVVERSWPVLNNNLRAGSERQSGYPFISNSRNHAVLQSDANAGPGASPFHVTHGLSISQCNLKPGFAGGLFQNQQTPLNGFVQGNHVFPMVQNESNFSGMDSEPNRHDLSKGLTILNSQRGKGSEVQKNPSRMLNPESALNFDFLGTQEQVNSQHSGALRFLQGPQANVNDAQLLPQQVMLKQSQDVQKQQLLQQGIWLQSSPNQFPSLEEPGMPLNGIPVNDTSNYSWQHGFGTNNSNQQQRGASASVQGSPGGLLFSPQHGQGFHVMGPASQHNDRSHYGVPLSVSEERFSQNSQLDNSALQRMPSSSPSVPGTSPDQAHVPNGASVPKQLGKASHSNARFNSDVLRQVNSLQRNASAQLKGRQTHIGYSETSEGDTSSSPASQNEATLDPTEERILFGGDDNIWGAFGMETSPVAGVFSMSDGTGFLAGFPSVQSGSWSALMQSALAETSSDNQGAQEEWSGLSVQNVETTIQMSQHNAPSDDPRQSVWGNGNMHPPSTSTRPFQLSNDGQIATVSAISGARQSDVSPSHGESENMQTDSSPRWHLDRSHLRNHSLEGSYNYVNVANSSDSEAKRMMSGSFGRQQSTMNPNNWKVLELKMVGEHSMLKNQGRENYVQTTSSRSPALVNSGSPGAPGEDSQQLQQHHGFDFWRSASSPMNFKGIQDNRNAPISESSGNNDMLERGHENKRNFAGAFRPNSANHSTTGAVRENAWLDTGESSNLREGLQNQSAEGFQKPAAFRKFQYHPMGNVDTGRESSYGIKQGATKPMISQDRGYMDQRLFSHPRLIGNADVTTISSEKFQADPRGTEAVTRGMLGFASDKLSGGAFPLNKNVQSSHNMLELLHKVDQSREHVVSPHLSSSDGNDNNETETSDGSVGHFQRNQFPTSKGFSLQLGPPSPRLQNFSRASPSQNPSATLPGSRPLFSKGVSTSSIQSSSSLRETPLADSGNNIFSSSGQTANRISVPNFQGNFSSAFASGFSFTMSQPPHQLDIGAHGSVGPSQSVIESSSQIPGQSSVMDTSHESAEVSQSDLDAAPNIPSKSELSIANQTQRGLPQFPTSQSSIALIVPEQAPLSRVLPDAWMGTSNQQHLLSAIPGNSTLGLVDNQTMYSNKVDMASSGLQKLDSMELQKEGHVPSESNEPAKPQGFHGKDQTVKETSSAIGGPLQSTVWGRESSMKPLTDAPLSISGRQGKVEAFDGYLRSSNFMVNYSSLHQVQAVKTADGDLDNRAMKRFKGLDSSLEFQSVSLGGEKTFANNMRGELPNFSDVDSEMLHFSSRPRESQGMSVPSPDEVMVSINDCPSNSMSNKIASVGGEHCKISHQMAPSEFEQYGGNMYHMDDARKMALLKLMQQPVIFHKPAHSIQMQSSADVHQTAFAANCIGNLLNCPTPLAATSEPTLLQLVLPLETSDPNFHLKSRKRKSIVPELLSWHKEVVVGIGRVQEISVAETEWAKACNRVAGKLDNESKGIEDGAPLQSPRRRLLLTTQLMQLLILPSPAAFLGGDAVVNVENVVYSATRKTLGDACKLISCSNTCHSTHTDDEKTNSETPEVSEKSFEQRLTKAIEYLVDKTRTLANELSRLDRRYSIADLRAEYQDMEKFSIINRFVKFHGRGHAEVAGMPSSSDAATSLLKFCPQRYVTAHPMPRNLPDRIQCLSL